MFSSFRNIRLCRQAVRLPSRVISANNGPCRHRILDLKPSENLQHNKLLLTSLRSPSYKSSSSLLSSWTYKLQCPPPRQPTIQCRRHLSYWRSPESPLHDLIFKLRRSRSRFDAINPWFIVGVVLSANVIVYLVLRCSNQIRDPVRSIFFIEILTTYSRLHPHPDNSTYVMACPSFHHPRQGQTVSKPCFPALK